MSAGAILCRTASLGPARPGPTPTYLRVYAGYARPARGLTINAFFHLPRPGSRVAPSPAMSTDAAAERASQPAQRDELAHSQTVPIGDEVLPLTIDTSPPVTTAVLQL